MSAITELQSDLEKAIKPEELLATYRAARQAMDKWSTLCDEIKGKLATALGEGNKLKTDDGAVTWAKGRSKLDKDAWKAAKADNAELAKVEETTEEWKKKLKEAQAEFSTTGAASLSIKVA